MTSEALGFLIGGISVVIALISVVFAIFTQGKSDANKNGYLTGRFDGLDSAINNLKTEFSRGMTEQSAKIDNLGRDVSDLRDRVGTLEGTVGVRHKKTTTER